MRRIKSFLGLFLTCAMSLSYLPSQTVSADGGISSLEVSVVGNGDVILDDYESQYALTDGDVFKANVTADTELEITVNAKEGNSIDEISLEGKPLASISEDTKSYTFDYKVPLYGGKVVVSFKEDVVEQVVEETTSVEDTKEEEKVENKVEVEEVKPQDTNTVKPEENPNKTEEVEKSKKDIIVDEYLKGEYDSKLSLEFRKELVKKHSLEKYVDDSFFFKSEYVNKLIDVEGLGDIVTLIKLSKKGVSLEHLQEDEIDPLLIEMMEENEDSAFVSFFKNLFKGNSNARNLSLVNHGNITYYENGILMGRTDMFSLGGRVAFCMDHSKTAPGTGVGIVGTSVITNSDIRKILYYGFSGPAQLSGWDSDGLRVATAMAISEVRHGDGRNLGRRLLNQVRGLAEPPSSFVAYEAQTEGGGVYQNLAYWIYNPTGTLQISKSSANTNITNGNNCYSVVGAEYGVYTNSNATGQVGTLVIGSNGWSQELTLNAGTYYLKETKAPMGYALDNTIHRVEVNSGNKTTRALTDKPQFDPINLLLRKVDADTGNPIPVQGASLADAQFTFKFYGGDYGNNVNPADLGVQPTKTWIMKTDKDGFIFFLDTYKVSGDAFWYNQNGFPMMPLGTLTVQETKAPIGYKLNPEIFVRKITSNGITQDVHTYNTPEVKEKSLNFTIKKIQEGTNLALPNVTFKHTKPDGSSTEIATNANGEIVLRGLVPGIHKILETKATEGYEVNTNEFVFEVTNSNTIRVISNTTNMGMHYSEVNGNGELIVENKLSPFKLKVVKVNDKNNFLEGAEFTLYEDSACTVEVDKAVSNANGELIFNDLKVGKTYYFKETKAPKGYKIPLNANGTVPIYEVVTESRPVNGEFIFTINGIRYTTNNTTGDIHLEGNKSDRVISVKVVNYIGMKLPATGSNKMIPLMLVGALMMTLSLVYSRKKKI